MLGYGPSFMTKFCSALYLENLLTNIFAKLNLRGGVSCMPAVLLFHFLLVMSECPKVHFVALRFNLCYWSGNFFLIAQFPDHCLLFPSF